MRSSSSRWRLILAVRLGAPMLAAQPSMAVQISAIAAEPSRMACSQGELFSRSLSQHPDLLKLQGTLHAMDRCESKKMVLPEYYLQHLILCQEVAVPLDHEHRTRSACTMQEKVGLRYYVLQTCRPSMHHRSAVHSRLYRAWQAGSHPQ